MWIPDYLCAQQLWVDLMITQIMVVVNAVFLAVLLYQAKASRSFTALPVPLTILTIAALPEMRFDWVWQLWIFTILLFLYLVQDVSDTQSPNGYIFFTSLILCVLSLWIPDASLTILYLWLVVLFYSAFSLRTIFASAIAVAVFAFYYAIAYYLGWTDEWSWIGLIERTWLGYSVSAQWMLTIVVALAGTLAIAFAAFRRSSYGFVSTRILLYHSAALYLVAIPFVLFPAADGGAMHAMLALAIPAITSIYLLQQESESRGITFLVYLLVAFALYMSGTLAC